MYSFLEARDVSHKHIGFLDKFLPSSVKNVMYLAPWTGNQVSLPTGMGKKWLERMVMHLFGLKSEDIRIMHHLHRRSIWSMHVYLYCVKESNVIEHF